MVVCQVVAAVFGDGLELVVLEGFAEGFPGGAAGAVEGVVGVVHAIGLEDGFEAAFIEGAVVGDEGKVSDLGRDLFPDFWEEGGVFGVFLGEAMDLGGPVGVVVGLWMDEAVESVYDLSVLDHDDADAAYAGSAVVGGFKVYCYEIVHVLSVFLRGTNIFIYSGSSDGSVLFCRGRRK